MAQAMPVPSASLERALQRTRGMNRHSVVVGFVALGIAAGCANKPLINVKNVDTPTSGQAKTNPDAGDTENHASKMLEEGRETFRYETFGSEQFWGAQLGLHKSIAGQARGGVGPGLTPRQALNVGLKVDADRLPAIVLEAVKGGSLNLDDPEMTLELLRADSVVGVKGFFSDERLVSVGIQCALCHSTVDDSIAKGIGERLDGWPNRDLDVGKIVLLAPNLEPVAAAVGGDVATVRKVLSAWGPGKYDAQLNQDGKGFRPDGKSAATVIPAAFGLAGVNLHTYTGWGSVTYWNAYVATTQMHGLGRFFDPRLNDATQFRMGARNELGNVRAEKDRVTSKLAALHFYQLAIPAPKPPKDSFDAAAAKRGEAVFNGKAKCATCHVPPLYTEPGWSMHTADEIGIDDFQASRSPDKKFYRTTPLRGLFARKTPGFYHDGRFPDLKAVVAHYQSVLRFELTDAERVDLIEFLKSL
jgi:mono/diheme cytochrome c family protein